MDSGQKIVGLAPPGSWTHCDDVDFHQGATIASGQDHLNPGVGGLVRLLPPRAGSTLRSAFLGF